ncbi:MAG: CPBP family intramembrane metalloprotease [Clostridiales bacterium]|jgi:membrane protease YdiL (CAAX protease family)|nr:CPBP family intramembrane metalloprotease [Clostridiales bacterium]
MKKHLITALKVIGFVFAWGITLSVAVIPVVAEPPFLSGSPAMLRLWWELLPLICILLISGIFVRFIEKKNVKILLLKAPLKNSLAGLILGSVWLGGAVLALFLLGNLRLAGGTGASYSAVWFLSVFLNVIMQEYLARGYLFALLKDKYGVPAAVIFTSAFFTAMHAGVFEVGLFAVLNVFATSVFLSLLLLYTESLLAPILAHFVWNAAGCLIFGAVALADDYPSLWNSVLSGDGLLSGGAAKIEGSAVTLIITVTLAALIFAGLLLKRKKQKR